MRKLQQKYRTIQVNHRALENYSTKIRQSLAKLECEEAIIIDKERFGKVRKSMMKALRVKYSNKIADETLNIVNKKIQKGLLVSSN